MKGSLSKILAVLLVLAMVFALAGCNKTTEEASEATKAPEKTEKQEEATPEPEPEEPVTLVLYTGSNVEEFPEGQDENNNMFIDFLREKTGYDLQWIIGPAEDAEQQFNLMMTSGDTPDMARLWKSLFASYASQGLLSPLDDAISEKGSYFTANIPEETWLAVKNEAGETLAIPLPASYTAVSSLAIRRDWLDSLGLQVPKTTEDLASVLQAVKEAAPAGEQTIPLMGIGAETSVLAGFQGIAGAFGVGNSNVDASGVYHEANATDAMKECLTYLADLYAKGLIDPNYPVNKEANMQETFAGGLTFMAEMAWWTARSVDQALAENDPDAVLEYIAPLEGPNGDSGYTAADPIQTYNMVPIHNADNAKYVVDFLNQFASSTEIMNFITYGPEGEYFELKDGVYYPKDNSAEIGYQVYYNYWDKPENFINRVMYKGFGDYFVPIEDSAPNVNLYSLAPPMEAVDNMASERTDITIEYFVKIISGALPIDAFDDFVAEWEASEGRDAEAAIQAWYDSIAK